MNASFQIRRTMVDLTWLLASYLKSFLYTIHASSKAIRLSIAHTVISFSSFEIKLLEKTDSYLARLYFGKLLTLKDSVPRSFAWPFFIYWSWFFSVSISHVLSLGAKTVPFFKQPKIKFSAHFLLNTWMHVELNFGDSSSLFFANSIITSEDSKAASFEIWVCSKEITLWSIKFCILDFVKE